VEFDTGVQRSRVNPLECGQNVVSLRNTQHAFTEDRVVGHQKAQCRSRFLRLCGRWDSNPQWANPPDPKSGACANSATPASVEGFRGSPGTRTRNLGIKSPLLSQLS
jgi:hypothetical protein